MAKETTPTTSTKTTANALSIIPANAIQKGIGLKAMDIISQWDAEQARIAGLVTKNNYRRDEATSLISMSLVKAFMAAPALRTLAIASFGTDRKAIEASNDAMRIALDLAEYSKDEEGNTVVTLKPEVQKRFGEDKKKGTDAWTKGQQAKKNFATFLKTATQNAVGFADLEISPDEMKIDEKSKALLIEGPKAEKAFGAASVLLNGSKQEGVKDDVAPTLKTIREIAQKKHGQSSKADTSGQNTTTKDAQVPDGNVEAAVMGVCVNLVILVNKLEGKASDDTRKSMASVVRALIPFLPELNPGSRASDNVRTENGAKDAAVSVAASANAKRKATEKDARKAK